MTIGPPHPAKYSDSILVEINRQINHYCNAEEAELPRVLDPFGGVGTIHKILPNFWKVGSELEYEWAEQAVGPMVVANALSLPFGRNTFDFVITSPCYGNRMADHHANNDACSECLGTGCHLDRGCTFQSVHWKQSRIIAKRAGLPVPQKYRSSMVHIAGCRNCAKCKGRGLSVRNTYRHLLGRDLTVNSAAGMQWGHEYRSFHEDVWGEVWRVLKPGGLFVLNVSNHIRKGEIVPVTEWHDRFITEELPTMERRSWQRVTTKRNRHGSNDKSRVDFESVITYQKAA